MVVSLPSSLQSIPWIFAGGGQQRFPAMQSQTGAPWKSLGFVRCCCDGGDSKNAVEEEGKDTVLMAMGRRQCALFTVASSAALMFSLSVFADQSHAKDVAVGAYLPPATSAQGFVQFAASTKDTPALRAGNVQPYRFVLPPTWKQARIANILSGNYCQPKCAEPWVEVKFEDNKQGTVQVFASPMVRLTNKPNAKIEEIGDPEKLISALGPFVTGNSYDPDEVVEAHVEQRGSQTYYIYTLDTPYARTGTHNLAAATAKGNVVLLFVVSANDAQWSTSQGVLRTVLESFQV